MKKNLKKSNLKRFIFSAETIFMIFQKKVILFDFFVIVTPAVYPRVGESRHIDIQSTGQKSVCDKHHLDASQAYVLIIQLDSPP
jgi:hypothetical protein